MGESNPRLFLPSNRTVEVVFRPDRVTSDAGALLLRQIGDGLGLFEFLGSRLKDPRLADACTWSQVELVRARLLQLAMGYTDASDSDDLRHDFAFAVATSSERGPRPAREGHQPSQPTLSRLLATLSSQENRDVLAEALVVQAGRSLRASGVVAPVDVDIDSMAHEVHGEQEGSAYNGYYGVRCFHPLVVTLGDHGDIVGARLREGNSSSAGGALDTLLPILDRVQEHIAPVGLVRMDAGFPSEGFFAGLEARGFHYVARIAKNAVLKDLADWATLPQLPPPETPRTRFAELSYAAGTWSRERRVVMVAIDEPGQMFPRVFYLVTSLSKEEVPAEALLERYRRRGNAEDAMGQWKEAMRPRFSSSPWRRKGEGGSHAVDTFAVNEATMLLSMLASNLLVAQRRAMPAPERSRRLAHHRERVLKVGARLLWKARRAIVVIAESARRVWMDLWQGLPPPWPASPG